MPQPSLLNEFPRTRLWIESGGREYALAQTCGDWVIPEEGVVLPQGPAVMVSVVGETRHEWTLEVDESAGGGSPTVPITNLQTRAVDASRLAG